MGTAEITKQVLRLSPAEKQQLITRIEQSLIQQSPEVEQSQRNEAASRLDAILRGELATEAFHTIEEFLQSK
jgi:hypothetical protein